MTAARSFLADRRLVWGCRIAIGALLLAAALSKIGEAAEFARQIHHLRFAPFGLENLIAVTLPWVELVAALAILSGVEPRGGAVLAAGLMAVFVVVVAVAMARHLDVECGCFGTADATRVGATKLFENLVVLAVALVAGQDVEPRNDGTNALRPTRGAIDVAGPS
jgi:uncharacterized membrane protein YphA (DoxX/SURF4 family)